MHTQTYPGVVTALAIVLLLISPLLPVSAEESFGVLIFSDDFERTESQEAKDEPGNEWTTSSDKTAGGRKQVDLREGAMHMHTAEGANHAVSTRHEFAFTDGTIGMRFRLDGEKDELRLNFADMSLKTVHAGHLFDAVIRLDKVSFEDKKTGFMNLEIRNARKNGTLDPEKLRGLNQSKFAAFPLDPKLTEEKWHDLLVHVKGDEITVQLNGETAGSFRSEGIAHPTKGLLRLLVPGAAWVDDVKIWRKE